VIAGPLYGLGTEGPGSLEDVRDFAALLGELRGRCERPPAFVIAHHESKAGQIAGAWEPLPDTLVHVLGGTNGATRVYWQKTRHVGELHRTATRLLWADGATFVLDEREPATEDRVEEAIVAYVRDHGGTTWNAVRTAVSGRDELKVDVRARLLEQGVLVDVGGERRGMALWHRDDPPGRPSSDRFLVWNRSGTSQVPHRGTRRARRLVPGSRS
jgi:hypothetical protein